MRKVVIILIVIIFFSALGYFCYGFYSDHYFVNEKIDKPVGFRYMGYACGDCYPQWQADAEGAMLPLRGKDIVITYKDHTLEDLLSNDTCMICKTFFVTGVLKKTLSGRYKLEADTYYFTTRPNCCN